MIGGQSINQTRIFLSLYIAAVFLSMKKTLGEKERVCSKQTNKTRRPIFSLSISLAIYLSVLLATNAHKFQIQFFSQKKTRPLFERKEKKRKTFMCRRRRLHTNELMLFGDVFVKEKKTDS